MSATSVILLKPSNINKDGLLKPNDNHTCFKFFMLCIWGLVAIITSAHTDINNNLAGKTFMIGTQDCLIMLITTWFLAKGLSESNQFYVIPWLLMSIWNIYNCQYLFIIKMFNILQRAKLKTILPWVSLGIDCLGLFLRTLLTLRVANLAMNQWYNNKLRNELKE